MLQMTDLRAPRLRHPHPSGAAVKEQQETKGGEEVNRSVGVNDIQSGRVLLIGLALILLGFSGSALGDHVNGNPNGSAVLTGIESWSISRSRCSNGCILLGLLQELQREFEGRYAGYPFAEEIRLQFIQTQGREPTAQEVAAICQMATSQHNQAVLNAGILVGGAVLGTRAVARQDDLVATVTDGPITSGNSQGKG